SSRLMLRARSWPPVMPAINSGADKRFPRRVTLVSSSSTASSGSASWTRRTHSKSVVVLRKPTSPLSARSRWSALRLEMSVIGLLERRSSAHTPAGPALRRPAGPEGRGGRAASYQWAEFDGAAGRLSRARSGRRTVGNAPNRADDGPEQSARVGAAPPSSLGGEGRRERRGTSPSGGTTLRPPMPRTTNARAPRAPRTIPENPFLGLLASVQQDVDARLAPLLDATLEAARPLGSEVRAMVGALADLCRRGGKRLRPALVVAGGRAASTRAALEPALGAGVALELLQAYFLIHDDWMDGDSVRRGGPTVHRLLARRFGDPSKGMLPRSSPV